MGVRCEQQHDHPSALQETCNTAPKEPFRKLRSFIERSLLCILLWLRRGCDAPCLDLRYGSRWSFVSLSGFLCVEAQRQVIWYGHSSWEMKGHFPGKSAGRCARYLAMSWLNLHFSPNVQVFRAKWKQRPSFEGIYPDGLSYTRGVHCGFEVALLAAATTVRSGTCFRRLPLPVASLRDDPCT